MGKVSIRVREYPLKLTSPNDIYFSDRDSDLAICRRLVEHLLQLGVIAFDGNTSIRTYQAATGFQNDEFYRHLLESLPAPSPDESLQDKNPKAASLWPPTKNARLTARDVYPQSETRVWWKCPKVHEWEATVASRNSSPRCPYCSGIHTPGNVTWRQFEEAVRWLLRWRTGRSRLGCELEWPECRGHDRWQRCCRRESGARPRAKE